MGRKSKKDYMQDGPFAELMEAAEQALAYERGARDDYRTMQVESPKSLGKTRTREAVSPEGKSGSQRKHKNGADK
jgi:hypothetical protein